MSSGNLQEKFWGNADIMEKLVTYLDVHCHLNLLKSKIGFTLTFLEVEESDHLAIWKKMIIRTLPDFTGQDAPIGKMARFEETRAQVLPLVALLNLMKDPTQHTLKLLHLICERSDMFRLREYIYFTMIQLSCPCTESSNRVASLTFLLLEDVDQGLKVPLQQEIVEIAVNDEIVAIFEDEEIGRMLLKAFFARATRQNRKMTRMRLRRVGCPTKESAAALFALIGINHTSNRDVV